MPQSPYHASGGSLPPDASTYVTRQADHDFYDALHRGDYCYVLNSRQMGKSSLRARTAQQLEAEGYRCVTIDLSGEIDTDITPEAWYYTLIDLLARGLQLPDFQLGSWWAAQQNLTPHGRFSRFLALLLERITAPIVIFIDEIDTVLSLAGIRRDDFFALIRACHNRRADDPAYNRLTFALLGVATPSDLIQDSDRTPFNIGRSIQLGGFSFTEAASGLLAGLEPVATNPTDVLQNILDWSGGQPFLTQKLCDLVVREAANLADASGTISPTALAQLVQEQVIDSWESKDNPEHLNTIQNRIRGREQRTNRLLGLYGEILQTGAIESDGSASQVELRLSGLVVERQNQLQVYNRIYARVFNQAWLDQELARVRPYAAAIRAWEASGRQEDRHLLQDEALATALDWAQTRTLGRSDYEFLVESQKLSLRRDLEVAQQALATTRQQRDATHQELEQANRALAQVNQELEASRQALAKNQRRTGWLVGVGAAILALSVAGAGIATARAAEATKRAQTASDAVLAAEKERRISVWKQGASSLGVAGLQVERTDLEAQKIELETTNRQINQEVDAAKAAQRASQTQFQRVNSNLQRISADLADRSSQLRAKNQELETLGGQVDSLNRQVADGEAELDNIRQQQATIDNALQLVIGTLGIRRLRNPYYALGGLENSVDYLQRSLNKAVDIQDRRGQGYANGNLGEMKMILGNYPEAIHHHQQHHTIAEEVQDRQGQAQAIGNLGEVYYEQGQYQLALTQHQQHLALARELQDKLGESQALANLGRVYLALGQPDTAIEHHQQSLTIAREIKDYLGQGQTLSYLGEVYYFRAEYRKALKHYSQHYDLAQAIEDRLGEEEALRNLAKTHRQITGLEEATRHYQQSLQIAVELGNAKGQAAALNGLGEIYQSRYQHQQAIDSYETALKLSRHIQDRAGEAYTLNRLGQVYNNQSQYGQALRFFQQSLVIRQEIGDRAGEGTTLNNIGSVYDARGNYSEALRYYQQSLTIRQEVGDRAGEGATLNNIGLVYGNQGNYDEALRVFQQSLAIRQEVEDRAGEGITLNNIGGVYHEKDNYSEALRVYQQSLIILQEVGDRAGEGTTLNNIGSVFWNQENYPEALRYYQASLAIRQEVGDRAGEGFTLNNIGIALAYRGLNQETPEDFLEAVPYIRAGLMIAIEIGSQADITSRRQSLINLLETIRDQVSPAYRQQCGETAEVTGIEIGEWCPDL